MQYTYKFLLLFLIIIVTTSFKESKIQEEILNIRNLTLKKGETTTFILDGLKKGDVIVPHLDIAVGHSRIKMAIGLGSERKKAHKSNAPYNVPTEGTYSIDVTSDKKVVIDFKLDRTYESAPGATVPLVRINNFYIGKEGKESDQPIVNYGFAAGSQLSIAANGIGIKHLQGLKTYDNAAQIPYQESSVQSFRLFWKATKTTDRIQGLRKISQIAFGKTNPPKKSSGGSSQPNVAANTTTTASDPFNIDFPEMTDNSGLIAEAMEKQAAQDSIQALKQDSLNAKLLEVMVKMLGEDPPEMLGFSNDTFEVVEVQPRMALNASNRKCMTISPEGGQDLVYWIGVGDEAKQIFLQKQQRALRSKPEYDNWLQAYYSVVRKPEFRDRKAPFPKVQGEQIEYAVVNDENRARFEAGLPYVPYRSGLADVSTSTHSGFATNVTESSLYLCACNRNRISPVKVFLMYNTFLVETVEEVQ